MELGAVEISDDVRSVLGDQLRIPVSFVESEGDCGSCRTVLGEQPVSVSLWHLDSNGTLALVPTHTACARSSYRPGITRGCPPLSYATVAMSFASPTAPTGRGFWLRRQERREDGPRHFVVLISPSRDVQVGSLWNGRWVTATESSFEVQGLVRSPSTNPPAVWGAMVGGSSGERTLQVQGPLGGYDVMFPSALGEVADGTEITVFVSDHVRITDSSASRVQALKDPAPDAPVFVSRAVVGSAPGDIEISDAPSWLDPSPEREVLRGSTAMRAAVADTSCCVRALLANDPSCKLLPIPVPVVLVEPIRAILQPVGDEIREMRVETALSGGLYPFTPTPNVPISPGLTMRRRGLDTELVTADGTVIGAGVLDALPERWEAALGITEGRVIVVYGAAIGVRPSAPDAPFPDADRRAELMQARATGTAARGMVGWS